MMQVIIVDDEPLARERLRYMLAALSDVTIVAEADGGLDAVVKIEEHKPDLLLLDVQMPELDGFGVLRMIELEKMPLVIFVTAYDEYAVEAFEVSAVDYLLKPIRRQRLELALTKAREKLAQQGQAAEQLTALRQILTRRPNSYLQRLPVRSQNRILILPVEQIVALKIEQGLLFVTTADGEYWTKYTTFTELENLLDPGIFMRIHRQVMVNITHVREVSEFDKHSARLKLTAGHQVTVSRSHIKKLRQTLSW
jgi:DNA-binding LytR/AlgR family response regulator